MQDANNYIPRFRNDDASPRGDRGRGLGVSPIVWSTYDWAACPESRMEVHICARSCGTGANRVRLDVAGMVEVAMRAERSSGAWREYARTRNRAMLLLLVFLFGSLLVALVSVKLFGSTTPGFVFALATAALWVYFTWQVFAWPCPQCGDLFGCPYRRKCRNCKLPKWKEPQNAPSGKS